ncbi:MAG TPA: hypothetical protein VLT37_07115, partial [Acidocella sp.]|nr:hypothetical protein [Acidocella sp.]
MKVTLCGWRVPVSGPTFSGITHMFCFQCEQTSRADGVAGCHSAKGVCGKDETTADLQDVLIYQLKGLGQYSAR